MKLDNSAKYENMKREHNGNNDLNSFNNDLTTKKEKPEEVNLEELLSSNKEGCDVSLSDLMSVAKVTDEIVKNSNNNNIELL